MTNGVSKTALMLIPLICLTGCGSAAEEDVSSITVNSDGSLDTLIVEDFDESLYSSSELAAMIDEEINEFASQGAAGSVTAQTPLVENGVVKVSISYDSADSYCGFNNRNLYVGTLNDALAEDMIGVSVKNVKDDSFTDAAVIEDGDKYMVVITDEAEEIICPGKVVYISDGVTLKDKKTAVVSEDMDGLAYILYQK